MKSRKNNPSGEETYVAEVNSLTSDNIERQLRLAVG